MHSCACRPPPPGTTILCMCPQVYYYRHTYSSIEDTCTVGTTIPGGGGRQGCPPLAALCTTIAHTAITVHASSILQDTCIVVPGGGGGRQGCPPLAALCVLLFTTASLLLLTRHRRYCYTWRRRAAGLPASRSTVCAIISSGCVKGIPARRGSSTATSSPPPL
jgi:hypothetical protein